MNKSSGKDRNNPNRKPIFNLLFVCSLIVLISGLATFASRYFFVAELLNNFRLQISVLIFSFGAILFAAGHIKYGAFHVVVSILVAQPVLATAFGSQTVPSGPEVFKLISYNVLGDNPNTQPVVELLAKEEADMAVVIEYTGGWSEVLKPLKDAYPYLLEAPRWHGFGIALFSRHRLENERIVLLSRDTSDFPFLLSEIVIDGRRLILAAGHFLAPMSPMRMEIRNRQMADAARLIEEYRDGRDIPVILVGDLNAVSWSPFVQDMMEVSGLRDSREGYWYQASWPNDNLLLRIPIDHALVSDDVHVHRRQLLGCYSSDHLPLLLEFSLPVASVAD